MKPADLYDMLKGIGISSPYASQLSRGLRVPSLQLAIKLYREQGVKIGPIVGASKSEIDALERVGARREATQ